jgi:hypothetical protein
MILFHHDPVSSYEMDETFFIFENDSCGYTFIFGMFSSFYIDDFNFYNREQSCRDSFSISCSSRGAIGDPLMSQIIFNEESIIYCRLV